MTDKTLEDSSYGTLVSQSALTAEAKYVPFVETKPQALLPSSVTTDALNKAIPKSS